MRDVLKSFFIQLKGNEKTVKTIAFGILPPGVVTEDSGVNFFIEHSMLSDTIFEKNMFLTKEKLEEAIAQNFPVEESENFF